jgi:hypothetical protein
VKYWIVIDEISETEDFIHVSWKGSIDEDEYHCKSVINFNELKTGDLERAIFSYLFKELEKLHSTCKERKERRRKLEEMRGKKYDDATWVLAEKLERKGK